VVFIFDYVLAYYYQARLRCSSLMMQRTSNFFDLVYGHGMQSI